MLQSMGSQSWTQLSDFTFFSFFLEEDGAHTVENYQIEKRPITSWQIDGKRVETVTDFILGGSKITADGNCNHEIKRHLLLGRKAMTNLDSRLKSRDVTLPTKVCLVKALVFLVVTYGCESWTIKKAKH